MLRIKVVMAEIISREEQILLEWFVTKQIAEILIDNGAETGFGECFWTLQLKFTNPYITPAATVFNILPC